MAIIKIKNQAIDLDAAEIPNLPATKITSGTFDNNKLTGSGAITINGSSVALGASTTIATGLSWQSTIVTASTLAGVSGNGYWINTTSNACTITLPSNPALGDKIVFVDYARNWGTNAITINQNSKNFQGNTSPNPVYNSNGQSVSIVYSDATQGWIPTVDDDVTLETAQNYSASMLIVAAGGAGGGAAGGGGGAGGAGGFRTSTQTLTGGSTYTVTVGSGGSLGTGTSSGTDGQGGNGGNSSISGTGITTITSTGGGGGGAGGAQNGAGQAAKDGGSGGGTGNYGTTSGGSGNTPSTSPSQGNNGGHMGGESYNGGGGGGGASSVGQNALTNINGGYGGAGTANSITGSSVTYAGGGGGGNSTTSTNGVGGAGGGGNGATQNIGNAQNGTANTGGGGGGGYGNTNRTAGTGGSGVVILSVPDASYSGTTTGSPTVATGVSGQTILTFTGDGSYTA